MLPTEKQRRYAINELQRQKIRSYAKANPLLNQRGVADWATREFGRKVNQSTMCDSLNPNLPMSTTRPSYAGLLELPKSILLTTPS